MLACFMATATHCIKKQHQPGGQCACMPQMTSAVYAESPLADSEVPQPSPAVAPEELPVPAGEHC